MQIIRTIIIILLLGYHQLGLAQSASEFFVGTDDFLKTHVKNGRVDYQSIKQDPEILEKLIDLAKEVSISLDEPKAYQAFWINAYNLLVIHAVVDHYPVESPLDIEGMFDQKKHTVAGKQVTLNEIENNLLRGKFPEEARFHFVLVCAGLGCPPLIAEAYMPQKLDSQMQRQTLLALNDSEFIKVEDDRVLLSQIFDWYREDFTQAGKTAVHFINQFREEKIDPDKKIEYYPYDWRLNDLN